ncbi:MAG TPA: A4/G1 family peptidase [Acidobacteriaceae bacterium]|nr:A4/G1 family peptidase [Acidobacteriaceae bacterium]
MQTTKLSDKVSVRTFPKPPAGFDPLTSDPRLLSQYGYPKKPSDPTMAARWEEMMRRGPKFVDPEFAPKPRKQRRLPKKMLDHGVENTDIWSGAVVHAPAGDSFMWVEGTYTIPDAYPPGGAQDGVWYSASTWVGIDGLDGSGDVLQAGCDSDVQKSGSSDSRQLNPWWEWYPAGSFWITTLKVVPGDTVNTLICVTSGSTTQATVYLYNLTSNIGVHFLADATAPTTLVGNVAEWVVERLSINTDSPELAQYGEVFFSEMNAGTVKGKLLQGGTGNTINMVDTSNNVLSEGIILTPTAVEVKYVGPLS